MKYNDVNFEKKVIECVAQLIFDKGIKGWNMDLLSAKVGIAKNTLYRIIGSKEDIIKKVVLEYIAENRRELGSIMTREDDYVAALKEVIHVFPKLLNSFVANHMEDIFNEYPAIEISVRKQRDELTKGIIEFIQKGIDSGELREQIDAELVFELLQTIVMGHIKQGYKGEMLSAKISTAFDYLVGGIRKV